MAMSKYPLLQQSVTLSGLGTIQFERSVEVLSQNLYASFQRAVPESKLLSWQGAPCESSVGRTMSFSNRYFSRAFEANQLERTPFSGEVDPKGFLSRALCDSLVHTAENEVQYLDLLSPVRQQPM